MRTPGSDQTQYGLWGRSARRQRTQYQRSSLYRVGKSTGFLRNRRSRKSGGSKTTDLKGSGDGEKRRGEDLQGLLAADALAHTAARPAISAVPPGRHPAQPDEPQPLYD